MRRSSGFSMVEMLVVLLIMVVITAMALPSVVTSLKGYRLHSDATSIAGYLNVTRMKAASQYAPYRLVVVPGTGAGTGTYIMERLCGNTPSTAPGDPSMNPQFDANCASQYAAFSTPQLEGGTQYVSTGDTFKSCRSQLTGSFTSYPGTISADPSPCPDPLYMYFNTRGSPVANDGSPLGNGGNVLYIQNQNKLVDAVTVSLGGRVSVSMWTGSSWSVR